jgi:SAM-dependent methyltransferase
MRESTRYIKATGQQNLLGAEIGVREGENAIAMLENLPLKNLALVDPYTQYFDDRIFIDSAQQEVYYTTMLQATSTYADQITVMRETSGTAALKFADNSLDFVYIDGCHSVKEVNIDINEWWRVVKPNGFLTGHDFWFPGVRAALHPFIASRTKGIFVFNDSDWLIKKEL